jgi:microcystin degradation protein MlrC
MTSPFRIAIAGFQHETNTFVTTPTALADFEQADSWPALLSDEDVVTQTQGMNLPIAGFVAAAAKIDDIELKPILWASAEPSGCVTDHAFETIATRILDALEYVDAVYLDLHGAMVTESRADGEGTLLSRVRARIGEERPLVASLDLHANITDAMVTAADGMTIYRTYPHIDMADTGARAFAMLAGMRDGTRPAKAWRQGDYLVPLHAQHTGADPARALYQAVKIPDGSADLALGFTASDIADAGPAIVAYADTQTQADHIADRLQDQLRAADAAFECALLEPAEAVAQAMAHPGTVVVADVQDNPGAGASSDTTGLLRELIAHGAGDALLGLMHDPDLARIAHTHGDGARFAALIGGRGPGDTPLQAEVEVVCLSDGQCVYTGEMYGGGVATLGPSVALRVAGTEIIFVVTSIRNQCLDLAQFTHFGLDPASASIVCVKSTAHFRADFEPIADRVLLTAAPGQFPCRLDEVDYQNLRPGLRRMPGMTG